MLFPWARAPNTYVVSLNSYRSPGYPRFGVGPTLFPKRQDSIRHDSQTKSATSTCCGNTQLSWRSTVDGLNQILAHVSRLCVVSNHNTQSKRRTACSRFVLQPIYMSKSWELHDKWLSCRIMPATIGRYDHA